MFAHLIEDPQDKLLAIQGFTVYLLELLILKRLKKHNCEKKNCVKPELFGILGNEGLEIMEFSIN